jgi:hypothetical protein
MGDSTGHMNPSHVWSARTAIIVDSSDDGSSSGFPSEMAGKRRTVRAVEATNALLRFGDAPDQRDHRFRRHDRP